jgi:hypothetical protein
MCYRFSGGRRSPISARPRGWAPWTGRRTKISDPAAVSKRGGPLLDVVLPFKVDHTGANDPIRICALH